MRSNSLALLGLSALSLFGLACDADDGRTPRVEELRFDGQAPDSELVLLFTAHIVDPDGDVGDGNLQTFINRSPSALGALPLRPLFLMNEVPLDATDCEIGFALELALNGDPQPGTRFELGVRAVDVAGNASELASVELELNPR